MKISKKLLRSGFAISIFLFLSFARPVSAYPYHYHNGRFVVKKGDTAFYNISYDSFPFQNPIWLDFSNSPNISYTNGTIVKITINSVRTIYTIKTCFFNFSVYNSNSTETFTNVNSSLSSWVILVNIAWSSANDVSAFVSDFNTFFGLREYSVNGSTLLRYSSEGILVGSTSAYDWHTGWLQSFNLTTTFPGNGRVIFHNSTSGLSYYQLFSMNLLNNTPFVIPSHTYNSTFIDTTFIPIFIVFDVIILVITLVKLKK